MCEEEVKLLGAWGSPFSWRLEVALKMKGVEYEYFDEDLMNRPKSSLLLEYNPVHKKIPVLVHNGKPIAESLVILEYIDEIWNDRPVILLPQDPRDRAIARFWAKFMDDKCAPALWRSCRHEGIERENAFEEACALLNVLEAELKDKQKRFFGGDTIGFVDIAGNFIGYWIGVIQEVAGVRLLTRGEHGPDYGGGGREDLYGVNFTPFGIGCRLSVTVKIYLTTTQESESSVEGHIAC
ncbi:glutathione S-transferase U8 [Eucalyptus grandis]|uniref:glutathione S-transferase U8 n=1 Tax=Eucalyptus grandis TaxID=71139 RepID=UPI00192E8812|nr:glutathione S-transferase U8 [Eucalyptus grandis]